MAPQGAHTESSRPAIAGQRQLVLFLLLSCAQLGRASQQSSGQEVLPGRKLLLAGTAKPDYSFYHRKADLLQKVRDIVAANPNTMRLEERKASDKEYSISMQVVQVQLGGLVTNHSTQARLFMDFGEHAREFISAELGLALLRVLAGGREAVARVLPSTPERAEKLWSLLQQVAFVVLPLENAAGRDKVEGGALCERKNGRGVDPNRNWEVDWGRKEKDYDPNEEFPGAAPFSEPEVRIVLDIARTFKPHVWVNVHSGMEAMFTPWDHKAEVPPEAAEALRVLQTLQKELFTQTCVVGSGGKSVGYLAHGTATDYMFEKLKVPLPFTWEIYGDMQAPFSDCFRMFNPLTKQHMESVIALWLRTIFRLIELLPTHSALLADGVFKTPTPPGSTGSSGPKQRTVDPGNGRGPGPAAGVPGGGGGANDITGATTNSKVPQKGVEAPSEAIAPFGKEGPANETTVMAVTQQGATPGVSVTGPAENGVVKGGPMPGVHSYLW
eukprot:CAMPEP_0119105008 /NCGR_PEP_ID=MMETSP1180-20130426/3080_1 /TAXON_ID=3052 ORGANISM="Chlamydomonas cf sp, Strain CCMP681" /NCGR_SAMPLE_ID=MMETSP1180 /ASSEMBLY_ACC=CAM_ASM_000741 /LENGTH=496 /DNA_ID=CAMNT_0007089929 /DNA_START=150 /DNA_END=1637 /DNA_ORIENTATION=-